MALEGNNRSRLREKVEQADLALSLKARHIDKNEWADANVNLAEALIALADEEGERTAFEHYRHAMDAYRSALEVFNRSDNFYRWGMLTLALARHMRTYAVREGGDMGLSRLHYINGLLDELYDAIDQYDGAFDRALINLERGQLMRAFADVDRKGDKGHYYKASVDILRTAAETFRLKERFEHWVVALNGMGISLSDLARVEEPKKKIAYLSQAIDAFKSVLAYDGEEIPDKDKAFTLFELGRTYMLAGQQKEGQARYEFFKNAVDSFSRAHAMSSPDIGADGWTRLQGELAAALSALAHSSKDVERLPLFERAIILLRDNLGRFEQKRDMLGLALTRGALGKDMAAAANLHRDELTFSLRQEACEILRSAIGPEIKRLRPSDWLSNMIELATVLHACGNSETGDARFEFYREAAEIYESAMSEVDQKAEPLLWARLNQWFGLVMAYIGEVDSSANGLKLFKKAELSFRQALRYYTPQRDLGEYLRLQSNVGHLLYMMARRSDCGPVAPLLIGARKSLETILPMIDEMEQSEEWIATQNQLGLVLWRLASFSEDKNADYLKSEQAFKSALNNKNISDNSFIYAQICANLAKMYCDWGMTDKGKVGLEHMHHARSYYHMIRDRMKHAGRYDEVDVIDRELDTLQCEIMKHRARLPFWHRLPLLGRFFDSY